MEDLWYFSTLIVKTNVIFNTLNITNQKRLRRGVLNWKSPTSIFASHISSVVISNGSATFTFSNFYCFLPSKYLNTYSQMKIYLKCFFSLNCLYLHCLHFKWFKYYEVMQKSGILDPEEYFSRPLNWTFKVITRINVKQWTSPHYAYTYMQLTIFWHIFLLSTL